MVNSIICADQDAEISRLLTALNIKEMTQSMLTNNLEGQISQMPAEQSAAATSIMNEIQAYFESDRFEAAIGSIYKDNFTAEEIRQLADFYSSEIGKRLISKTPAIAQSTATIIQNDMLPIVTRAAEQTKTSSK